MRSLSVASILALSLVPTTLRAQPVPTEPAPPTYGPPAPPPAVEAPSPAVEAPPPAVPAPAPAVQPARAACATTYAAPPPAYAYPVVQPPAPPRRQPAAIGISLGSFHSEPDAMDGIDASGTYGLFGRVGLGRHLFAQLDVGRVDRDDGWRVYATTASLAYAFGSSRLVPILRAGVGYDHASADYLDDRSGYRAELGAGLEARFDGGVLLGVDLAAGSRTSESTYCDEEDSPYYFGECGSPILRSGSYRAAKVTLGIAF